MTNQLHLIYMHRFRNYSNVCCAFANTRFDMLRKTKKDKEILNTVKNCQQLYISIPKKILGASKIKFCRKSCAFDVKKKCFTC